MMFWPFRQVAVPTATSPVALSVRTIDQVASAVGDVARRTAATAKLGGAERAVLDAARRLYDEAAEGKGGGPPGRKALSNRIRDTCGLNLTVRELERVAKVVEGREE